MQESIFVLKNLVSKLASGQLVVKEGEEWMVGNRIEDLIQAIREGTREKQSSFSSPYSPDQLAEFFSKGE